MAVAAILAYLQYQALFLWLVLAAGWTWSGVNRRRERLRRQRHQRQSKCGTCGNGTRAADLFQQTRSPATAERARTTRAADAGAAAVQLKSGGAAASVAFLSAVYGAPPVSVVMPVKGCRPHSLDNWESHLAVQYGGPLEFLFVVEAADDPAVPLLRELRERCSSSGRGASGSSSRWDSAGNQGQQHPQPQQSQHPQMDAVGRTGVEGEAEAASGRPCGREVRLVVAGLASSCSQKAHNLCAGIEACDPRVARDGGYVLCLDDDVALHPGTLEELVGELERRPELFMATGYPFDIPPPGTSFPAYLALSYHLPLLIAFSVAPDTSFVWGGCMLLRGRHLAPHDPAGLLAAWRHGGYSDDLILASFCTERRLGITVPPFAVFPQRLDPRMGWRAWLNYLHRQLFVLDTYTNDHNRITNHTMMVVHSVLSWLLVLPSLTAIYTAVSRLLAALVAPTLTAAAAAATAFTAAAVATAAATTSDGIQQSLLAAPPAAAAASSPVASPGAHPEAFVSSWGKPGANLTGTQYLYSTPGSEAAAAAAVAPGSPWSWSMHMQRPEWLALPAAVAGALPESVWAVLVGWAAAHLALVFMTAEILALFRVLSPASPPIPLRHFRWCRLWAALLGANAVLPLVMTYTYLCPEVEWGGVVYRKRAGLVKPVRRKGQTAVTAAVAAAAAGPAVPVQCPIGSSRPAAAAAVNARGRKIL